MEEKLINKDIIEKLYESQEEIINEKIKEADRKIEYKIKDINYTNINNESEVEKILEIVEENYNIKIGEYLKELYKQGVIDGINLMINCLKQNRKNIKKSEQEKVWEKVLIPKLFLVFYLQILVSFSIIHMQKNKGKEGKQWKKDKKDLTEK